MSHLIDAESLIARLDDPDLRVIDARFELTEPEAGRAAYQEGHVPGAVYFDLDRDLSSPVRQHGGRHPLPDMRRFAAILRERGIGDRHEVVVVDQSGTMYAARAWWLLRYAGHDAVRFLGGGMQAYGVAGGPLTTALPAHPPAHFTLRLRQDMVVDAADVRAHLGDPDRLVLDARAPERFRGEVEPLDPKAGHVPGARNVHYQDTMGSNGFRPPRELRKMFALAEGKREVVAYCGSGVSAAHLLLAMEEAGMPGAKLYAGSWSDWSSYDDLPVETGD
jgi:thiosulfate/3-mercaptopyruvate sulfurtransferase